MPGSFPEFLTMNEHQGNCTKENSEAHVNSYVQQALMSSTLARSVLLFLKRHFFTCLSQAASPNTVSAMTTVTKLSPLHLGAFL